MSDKKHVSIPESENYWGSIIGEWQLDWTVHPGTTKERFVKGEWIFSNIQDNSFHWQNIQLD